MPASPEAAMTVFEDYLEAAAAADAMEWWNGLTDEDRVDVFVERGPVTERVDAWEAER